MTRRKNTYPHRRKLQELSLKLPLFPTTTIGSFPQTKDVRLARADYRTGKKSQTSYEASFEPKSEHAIRFQEEVGLDVLVHGEFERNDMVEYFGEQFEDLPSPKTAGCKVTAPAASSRRSSMATWPANGP